MVTLRSGFRDRTLLASARSGPARRAVAALLLVLVVAACSAPDTELESVPAGVTTGAAPTAPPTPLETYADGGDQPSAPSEDDGQSGAELVVTHSEWSASDRVVDAGGYVSTIESDGRCTLRLTQGDRELTGEGDAYPDASTTACGSVRVAVPAGLAGTWEGVLEYESPSTRAASEPFTVTVR
jgi:hypothetical protein